ncbi:unnamed protein product [Macrosiphum euphorbiae]|uniref:HAT C-terminal dimerisation domain-containing protein n=1 Tax=Macrosiphum euphorbiae TaxID=13131 RepID=A0AAV0YAP1_9HEMI|nr:unnamed protein product [Macrosiphum euphorbiae]
MFEDICKEMDLDWKRNIVYGKFLSAVNLRREYLQFANTSIEFEKLVKLPEKLHEQLDHDLTDVLNSDDNDDQTPMKTVLRKTKNHKIQYICYLNAFPERAFSKLKLIKTRLRSTMCEERLESLLMISCEKDIPIDTDEVIKCFSSYSPVLLK